MRARGMTLVELVLVVALLGILSTVAVVSMGPIANRYRQREGVEVVEQFIGEAQARARSSGRCHRVVARLSGVLAPPGTPGDSIALEARPDVDCEAVPATVAWVLVDKSPMPTGVQVSNFDDATWTWTEFRPNGRIRANASTSGGLTLSAPGQSDRLLLTVAHGVTCSTLAATPGPCP